ncbi:AhpC/TSA family protein [Actibacterium atlanticum]|uniref:Glutathione-dependent peroxiredoxin n=1 Tax=Actibacterium atlanticum TaxID=1461693 RepID=A0A058ZKP7_9RHOB|nr:peroxiredoxin [Actibacterium atlanticum]KCV81780.1 AhpC/TSA family protein [Actibacterium atlanticum]
MKPGTMIPQTPVQQLDAGEVRQINLAEFSKNKTVMLVSVPGAFTPTCNDDHVPAYIAQSQEILDKGVDDIVILSASDFFVTKAWSDHFQPPAGVQFMADGSQQFAAAAGQQLDLSEIGLGMRAQRYAAVLRDGKVEKIFIEPDATVVTGSGASEMQAHL